MNNINLKEEIESIAVLKRRSEEFAESAASLRKDAEKKSQKISERIKGGETTGDLVRDFVLSKYGFLDDELEKTYRDLQTKTAKHLDEFLMVIAKSEEFHGCAGFGHRPRPEEYRLEIYLYLGVVKAPGLVLDSRSGRYEFKMPRHACYSTYTRNASVSIYDINSSIFWARDLGFSLKKPLECKNPYNRTYFGESLVLDLKIGDEEVNAWFKEQNGRYDKVFQEMVRLLNRLILTSE